MLMAKTAYLFKPNKDDFVSCVITDKSMIKNANDEHFEEVTLLLSKKDIEDWNELMLSNQEIEDEDCHSDE